MSLKFNERKKQWQILKVIDCDAVRRRMTREDLKRAVEQSWNQRASCPVVVNKGKRTWIEWKKFVNLGNGQSVAMSLKFNERKKQWQILKVIDCDAVRRRITREDLKRAVEQSWNQRASCPVVVNKGKRTWIEWK